jgi:hypothetical protein
MLGMVGGLIFACVTFPPLGYLVLSFIGGIILFGAQLNKVS